MDCTGQKTLSQGYFETRFAPNEARNQVWQSITRYLAPYWDLPGHSSVLELGTGYGSWIRSVPAKEKHALDIHPELHDIFSKQGITGVKTKIGTCTDLSPWSSHSQDLILASNLLEHLAYDDVFKTVSEVKRVLKPGGKFCVVQPNFALCSKTYFDDFTHQTIFTDVGLKDLFMSHGLEEVRTWRRFMPFSMKTKFSRLTSLVPLYLRSPIKPLAGQMCLIVQKPKK